MELVEPTSAYKESFIEAVKEFQADDDYTHRSKWYRSLDLAKLERDFDSFIARVLSRADDANIPTGFVPESEFWLVDDGEFVGRVSVRHRLEGRLKLIGGHIGFDIRPNKRGKGYGNEILRLALGRAKELGLDRVLLTHDIRNKASQKIILKNGGVFEDEVVNDEKGFEGYNALRYWIDIR